GLGSIGEVYVKTVQMQRFRIEEVDKKTGFSRERRRGAIRIRRQKRELMVLFEANGFCFGPRQHGSTIVAAGISPKKRVGREQVVTCVISVRPHAELVVIVEYIHSVLENVAMILAGCVGAFRHSNAFISGIEATVRCDLADDPAVGDLIVKNNG